MAYGGGKWLPPIQNKRAPGTYIHFSSKARPTNIFGERGIVACGLEFDWGAENELLTVEPADLQKESYQLFGAGYTDPQLLPLRELLANARLAYIYRLNGGGEKATATVETLTATAKYSGIQGNKITFTIVENIDDAERKDLLIEMDGVPVHEAIIETLEDANDNDYIDFSGALAETAGTTLQGGSNGETVVKDHTDFMELLESKYINVLAYAGVDEEVKRLYKSYTERRVTLEGAYFQTTLYNFVGDSELIISVGTKAIDRENEGDLVYWIAGAEAGCEINETVGNKIYNGELEPDLAKKQRELIALTDEGHIVLHEVDGRPRVFADVNTFTDFSISKNEDFSKNQNIRVLHQLANDTTTIFNTRYLDKVQNNELGRIILKNDLYNHATKLEALGAIENLEFEDIIVERGVDKDAVTVEYEISTVMAMDKLYMAVIVA